jgi:ribose transport system permease protein
MNTPFKKFIRFIIEYNTVFIFLLMLMVSAMASEAFFTPSNFFNLVRQVTPIGIISMGMLLVILTGGIDLSVGSVVAMTGVLCAFFTRMMPLPLAIIASLGCGVLVGSVSGYLVAYHRMAPFIATLALMSIVRGLAFIF